MIKPLRSNPITEPSSLLRVYPPPVVNAKGKHQVLKGETITNVTAGGG
jgi:hypothetical protein